jgi:glycerol-3-phosphate acyltransferase PlsY
MDLSETAQLTGLIIGAYLLGSVPFGLILTKRFSSVDIRKEGSGNIGATNVRRVAGRKLGALTLAGDMLKGVIPVYLAGTITGCEAGIAGLYVSIVAFAAFLGHIYPVFLKFKDGGKGVATAAGSFLVISPLAFLAAVTVFAAVVHIWRRVSAASLAASAVLPVVVWFAGHSIFHTSCAAVITLFIFVRHRDNIKRLLSDAEPEI